MKQFIVDRHTTPNTPTLEQVPTEKIPLYPTEQDLLDDLANLEVGQIAGTIDPAESELIGVLIQRIQELENKLESDDVYSTDEVKTNKKIIINGVWKDVYRKVVLASSQVTASVNTIVFPWDISGLGIDRVVSVTPHTTNDDSNTNDYGTNIKITYSKSDQTLRTSTFVSSDTIEKNAPVIIEYTKTTD